MKKPKKTAPKQTAAYTYLIVAILLLAVFLRFIRLSELFHWTMDEEYWSYIPFNIATGYHLPLIGGHISGTGLYSGPLFVWLMAIPFFLTRGNPLGIAAVVSGLGVVTTFVIYLVGKVFYGKKAGILAAFFSASSCLMILYDRKYWNASPIPLLSLATIFCLYKISQRHFNWAYLLAIVLAIAFHAHMTSGVLLVLVVGSWLLFKLPIAKREIFIAIAIFIMLQTPLVVFELRHGFTNIKALQKLLSQSSSDVSLTQASLEIEKLTLNTLGRLVYLPPRRDIANELTLCSEYQKTRAIPPVWAIGIALTGILFLFSKWKEPQSKLLGTAILANIVSLLWYRLRAPVGSWYPGQLSEYFLLPSFPVLFLALGRFCQTVLEKLGRYAWIGLAGVFMIILFNINALLTAYHSDGFAQKQIAVNQAIALVGNQPFSLNIKSDDPCRLYGYRYLFSYLGKEPVQSYLDPQFGWLYQRRLPKARPTRELLINNISGTIDVKVINVPETDLTP